MEHEDLKGQRVALYARYSSEHQSSASIDDQLRRLRAELERRGGAFDPNLVFADHAVSGASMQRPAFERMVRLVDQKPRGIDAILVEDLSRIGRDSADLFMLQRVLEFQGVRLIGVADGVDTFAGHSRLTYGLKALVSSMYLHDLRDKTKRGLVGRALKGFSTGGLPLGFTSRRVNDEGSEIVVDEARAALVRRVFALYLEGRSCAEIAGLLNREG